MTLHGIKAVTLKTGLSSHVIRVWEKRYNAVTPQRTETNRRQYSDEDLERLCALATLTRQGYSISNVANSPMEDLQKLLEDGAEPATGVALSNTTFTESNEEAVSMALTAIESYDQSALNTLFDQFNKTHGYSSLIEKLIVPLMHQVGAAWHSGDMSTAEEHAATSFIKDYLSQVGHSFSANSTGYAGASGSQGSNSSYAPTLLVTTPSGQLHEIGAVIAASLARKLGWKVVYLGPSLPAKEIAGAAEKMQASAVLLSLVYPADDPRIGTELAELRNNLGVDYPIMVGGSAVGSYYDSLKAIDATVVSSMSELNEHLLELRAKPSEKALWCDSSE